MGARTSADLAHDDAKRRARFRAVFDRNFEYVWLSLRRLGVADRDVEDVVQNLFVQVDRHLDEYDDSRPIRPWLFAFAVRFASDWRRLARHRVELLGERRERPSSEASAEESFARQEDLVLLLRALEQVEMGRRGVLILYELDEVPMKEIAASLGIPLFTAYSRLRLAREELTDALRRLRMQEDDR